MFVFLFTILSTFYTNRLFNVHKHVSYDVFRKKMYILQKNYDSFMLIVAIITWLNYALYDTNLFYVCLWNAQLLFW